MSEKFCLKWNDFHSNLSNSFGLLRNEQYLQDVKLVTDDQQIISAHKLVLSVSSEYFQNIFQNSDDSKLILCLEGVSKNDLNNCLDYMYNGEVQIFQDDLDRFLNVAQRFKIKGLLTDSSEDTPDIKYSNEEIADNYTLSNHENNIQVLKNDEENRKTDSNKVVSKFGEGSYDMKSETEKYIEKLDDGNVKCTVCGKISRGTSKTSIKLRDMMRHIETHIEGLTYNCNICSKSCRSQNSLKNHKFVYHK